MKDKNIASADLIADTLSAIGKFHGKPGEWAEKYGARVDSKLFISRPFCWCGSDDCPWCTGCDCPASAWQHFKDGKPISAKQFSEEFYSYGGDIPLSGSPNYKKRHKEWEAKLAERNLRYKEVHTPTCDYCLGKGKNATKHGAEAGKNAPNFWYKPTNFKVWNYKYIGRGQETNRPITVQELADILKACTAKP